MDGVTVLTEPPHSGLVIRKERRRSEGEHYVQPVIISRIVARRIFNISLVMKLKLWWQPSLSDAARKLQVYLLIRTPEGGAVLIQNSNVIGANLRTLCPLVRCDLIRGQDFARAVTQRRP